MALSDPDELVLECRDQAARAYIGEAVACYRAGAFRSCIVATWNAVVFDFLNKLRQLELTGDKQARAKLAAFEVIRAGGDSKLVDALKFERDILASASTDFELLTPLEKSDLERLHEDRNRCAHPSMQSLDTPYQPSAELARTHVRNAVECFLSKAPVQGRAAFERIIADIKSPYFPQDAEEARKRLEGGPVSHARKNLISDLVKGLCKSLLHENRTQDERSRQFAALGSIVALQRAFSEEAIKKDLPAIMDGVAEADLGNLLELFRVLPLSWEVSTAATRTKVRNYIEGVADPAQRSRAVAAALSVQGLRVAAEKRLDDLTVQELGEAVLSNPLAEFAPRAVAAFGEAGAWRDAESRFDRFIAPLFPVLSAGDVTDILTAASINVQIWDAGKIPSRMLALFDGTARHHANTLSAWRQFLTDMNTNGVEMRYRDLDAAVKRAGK